MNQVLDSLTQLLFFWCFQVVCLPMAGQGRAALSRRWHCLHARSLAILEAAWMQGWAGPRSSKPPARSTLPLERGARRASCLLAQRGGLQSELLEVLAMSSLIFLPLAFSAECFTSSLRQAQGERNSLCVSEERGGGAAWMGQRCSYVAGRKMQEGGGPLRNSGQKRSLLPAALLGPSPPRRCRHRRGRSSVQGW